MHHLIGKGFKVLELRLELADELSLFLSLLQNEGGVLFCALLGPTVDGGEDDGEKKEDEKKDE